MKKYAANTLLIILTLSILGLIIYQIGSPIVEAYKQHGIIGLFSALIALIIIVAIGFGIIKLFSWAVDNCDL